MRKVQDTYRHHQTSQSVRAIVEEMEPRRMLADTHNLHVFLNTGGSLNGQSVSQSDNVVEVPPGGTLSGTVKIRSVNAAPSGHVVPLIWTPSWGAPSQSYTTLSNWIANGTVNVDVKVSLRLPSTPGSYFLVFASNEEIGADRVASGTNWTVNGGSVWNDGNELALLSEAKLQPALTNGFIIQRWLYPSGHSDDDLGLNFVKVVVRSSGPEAEVRGNYVVIADNDTTPSASDFTDFGSTLVGTPITRTFTVKNTGTASLTTSALTLPAGFAITEPLSKSIAAGSSDTFTVKLPATVAGKFSGNVSFANNDSNENPYNFAIKGAVTAPTFSFNPTTKVLTVTGTSGNDFIRGSVSSNVLTMKVNSLSKTFNSASSITRIVVNALGGNDLVLLSQSVNRPTSLNGGDGHDTIYGGSGTDVINGGNGMDWAFRNGSDTVTLVEEILA